MSTQQIRACGYIRVSSKEQVKKKSKSSKGYEEKFSLPIQREAIAKFCETSGYALTKMYADEGISGGSVKNRAALQQCLTDGLEGKFNVLVVHRLSRFGRNARELLDNYHELQEAGVELRSISEGIDFGNRYGKAILGMLAIVAELENDIRTETMLEGRIATARDHKPATGRGIIGRTFNEETQRWELDWEVVPYIQWAANGYLSGELKSMWEIKVALEERGIYWSEQKVSRTLAERCGDTWTVKFKGEEPITYTNIERILDDVTIERIHEQIAFNRTNNRMGVKKYVLSGYLFCKKCGRNLTGSNQVKKEAGNTYWYYNHPSAKKTQCHITTLNLKEVESSVFRTIFEFTSDWPSFEKAIADSLPDESVRETLKSNIKHAQRQLDEIHGELNNISQAIAKGSNPETHLRTEQELYERREMAQRQFELYAGQLDALPDAETVKREAETIRIQLFEKYVDSPDRINEMTYEEKRQLLHWLFGGRDETGRRYGIYINAVGKGKDKSIEMHYHGKIGEFKGDSNYKTSPASTKKQIRSYNIKFSLQKTI
jgi:DNA invertase Pin-like site-specific DNA recombinase